MKDSKNIFNQISSDIIIINSNKIISEDIRFDAGYYEIKNNIDINNDIEFFPLAKIATVIFPGIFKRNLTENRKYGIKFLTTSDIMMIEPASEKYLSTQLTSNIDIYSVSDNTLLVSRSGSIGNTIYLDNRLKDFAITEDALRVKPFENDEIGFLYFYFTSEYGNDLITGKKSGAVIDHIYEEDLLKLKIPLLKSESRKILNGYFYKVKKDREEAHLLIEKARILILEYNNLPPLSDTDIETRDPEKETQIRITNTSEFTDDYRLDAHFYNPIVKKVEENIKQFSEINKTLSDLTSDIILGKRFKRNYVESDFGTPFLSGKNIIQIRPSDIKHLSDSEISFIDELLIKKNWTLVTCSGTLGRTCFVYNNYEDYAASQHILRVVPNEKEIDAGYLYCFLSTDYGFHQIIKYKYGSVIDEIDDKNIANVLIPIPTESQQKEIGDLVRQAYDLRAEAIRLEDEAQELLTKELTKE